jgi:DNA polymerase-3 subunit delta'
MLFKEVIGQNKVIGQLTDAVKKGRISHSHLFLGPDGAGTLALAIAFAQYISCTQRNGTDSCNTCASCLKYNKLIHPDLHFVFPVNTTKTMEKDNLSSDDFIFAWREAVIENPYLSLSRWYDIIGIENKQGFINVSESKAILSKLSLKSFESDYKIMIIWHPEKMHPSAANKLLKIIEEPPDKTIFLAVTDSTDQILPTVLSRFQIVKVSKINDNDLSASIKEKFGLDGKKLKEIVSLSDGNYQKAIENIGAGEENNYNLERFIMMMRNCYSGNMMEILKWVDDIALKGRERQKDFLDYSLSMIRKNFLLSLNQSGKVYLTEKESEFSDRFHPFINMANAHQIADEINKAYNDIERNAFGRIVFLDLILNIIKLIRKQN